MALLFFANTRSAAETNSDETNHQTNDTTTQAVPTQDQKPIEKKPSTNKGTDLRSDHQPDVDKLRAYLETVKGKGIGSPLAAYAPELAQSKFWALIVAICHPEQYNCTSAPYNNYWGMMKPGGGLRHFQSIPEAIAFMDQYFADHYAKRPTVESWRGVYCASACYGWESTVLRVKKLLESTM